MKILISVLALSFILFSCDTYNDGPQFSLLTKKQRMTGTWELKEYYIGPDLKDGYAEWKLEIERDGEFKSLFYPSEKYGNEGYPEGYYAFHTPENGYLKNEYPAGIWGFSLQDKNEIFLKHEQNIEMFNILELRNKRLKITNRGIAKHPNLIGIETFVFEKVK